MATATTERPKPPVANPGPVVAGDPGTNTEQAPPVGSTPEIQPPPAPTVEEALASLYGPDAIQKLIQAGVQAELQRKEAEAAQARAADLNGPMPEPALAIFRCDVYPNAQVLELDMSADVPKKHPTGKWIKFRLGQFRAMTQNQVDQLRWMAKAQTHTTGDAEVIGGFPQIYEDQGEAIFRCSQPDCRYETSNKAAYRSHMFGLHGAFIND